MDLREIGLGGVNLIRQAQDRDWWWAVVSAVMNLQVLAPRSYVTRLSKQEHLCTPYLMPTVCPDRTVITKCLK
jgi:hypothetical protein